MQHRMGQSSYKPVGHAQEAAISQDLDTPTTFIAEGERHTS
jgi:hypothetical protein